MYNFVPARHESLKCLSDFSARLLANVVPGHEKYIRLWFLF